MKKKITCAAMAAVVWLCSSMTMFAAGGTDLELTPITPIRTEFDGLDKVTNDVYIYETDIGNLQLGRLDVDLQSETAMRNALANPILTQEVKNELLEKYQLAQETGQSLVCTVFSPELLPDEMPDAELNSVKYSTYNGANMKSELVYTYGLSTGWEYISTGVNASTVADGVANLVLLALSKSKTVTFVSAGKTVLDFFIDMWGESYIIGHRDDYFQMRLIYDDVSQFTYREFVEGTGDWRLGLSSQKVTLKKIGTEQYYFNGNAGKTTTKDVTVSTSFESPNFSSPWAKAYQWITDPQGEFISWKVGSKTFMF